MINKILVPAIAKSAELQQIWKEHYYTQEMFYCQGGEYYHPLSINENNDYGQYAYAVIDNDKIIGYISYYWNCNSRSVTGLMIISFDKGNPNFGIALHMLKKEIISRNPHRIEWRMVGGNPVEEFYDKIIKQYNGRKILLRDGTIDKTGHYLNDYIYEIIMEDNNEKYGSGN